LGETNYYRNRFDLIVIERCPIHDRPLVFYPEASEARCEAALVLDIDPVGLVRGKGSADGLLDQYVNDRPYAVSSFLSVALTRTFRTAMGGTSKERPDLAQASIPLGATLAPLPARGSEALARAGLRRACPGRCRAAWCVSAAGRRARPPERNLALCQVRLSVARRSASLSICQ
jgi:hypothetical protein